MSTVADGPETNVSGRVGSSFAIASGSEPTSWSARLIADPQLAAKKLAEEAVETALAAAKRDKAAVATESADLVYNLVVLWVEAGVNPKDVWDEMTRRERLFGIAEKLPKRLVEGSSRRKVVSLESRRARKRRAR